MDQSLAKKRRIDSDEGGVGDMEEIKKWLRGLSSDQLINFAADSAARHQVVYDDLQILLNENPDMRKLFIRSIAYETTEQTIRSVFEQFGEIESLLVVTDPQSGKSKGFAFVTFLTMAGAQSALAAGTHTVDGREIHVHLASEKNSRQKMNNFAPTQSRSVGAYPPQPMAAGVGAGERKLFVHGLSWNTTSDTMRREFEQFGPVEEAIVTYEKESGKSRGFGFVTFYSAASSMAAAAARSKYIDGRTVQFNFASERKKGGGAPQYGAVAQQATYGAVAQQAAYMTQPTTLNPQLTGTTQTATPQQSSDVQAQLQMLQANQLRLQLALTQQQYTAAGGGMVGGQGVVGVQQPGAAPMQQQQYPPQAVGQMGQMGQMMQGQGQMGGGMDQQGRYVAATNQHLQQQQAINHVNSAATQM